MAYPFSIKKGLAVSEVRERSKSVSSHTGIRNRKDESKPTVRYHGRTLQELKLKNW